VVHADIAETAATTRRDFQESPALPRKGLAEPHRQISCMRCPTSFWAWT